MKCPYCKKQISAQELTPKALRAVEAILEAHPYALQLAHLEYLIVEIKKKLEKVK